MKKLIYFLFFTVSVLVNAQKITEQQAEKTTDFKMLAAFIKENPTHPRVPEFKRKLVSLMNNTGTGAQSNSAKPVVKPLNKDNLKTEVKSGNSSKSGPSEQNKRTADLLTHLFNNDPNSKEAYIQITNTSKCNLVMKISGKKFYNLTIPANNQNFILVDKGTYTLTTSVCDAKYSSTKSITGDISITLGSPKMTKKKR